MILLLFVQKLKFFKHDFVLGWFFLKRIFLSIDWFLFFTLFFKIVFLRCSC